MEMESTSGYLETLKYNTPGIGDPVQYAESIFQFLLDYDWLFRDVPVQFLSKQCDAIPDLFKEVFLSMDCPAARLLSECPDSDCASLPAALQPFISRVHELTMPSKLAASAVIPTRVDHAFAIGMKLKKQHEVERLASLIRDVNLMAMGNEKSVVGADEAESRLNINTIVDVGAGKGWVGQVMTHNMGMDVINLEGNISHNSNASIRETKVQHRLQLKQRRVEKKEQFAKPSSNLRDGVEGIGESVAEKAAPVSLVTMPPFIVHFALDFGSDMTQFETLIWRKKQEMVDFKLQHSLCSPINSDATRLVEKFCLISLHGCGDLSPSVLHAFTHCPSAATLVCVGCCYHRLSFCELRRKLNEVTLSKMFSTDFVSCSNNTNDACSETKDVFPMSRVFQGLFRGASTVSNIRGMLGVAAKYGYGFDDLGEEELTRKANFLYYRAVLELVLHPYFSKFGYRHWIRKIKAKEKSKDFRTYLTNAMKNLMLTDHIEGLGTSRKPEEMVENWVTQRDQVIVPRILDLYEQELEKSKYIIPFMAMECAASRVIESALTLDRYLYLIETENVEAAIVPIFDKTKSPRNLAIVGWKKMR